MTLRRPGRAYWALVCLLLVADQTTKAWVRHAFHPGEGAPLIPGIIELVHVRNVGAAFGLLPGRQPLFILTSFVVLLVIAAYWRRSRPTATLIVSAIALVTAGAVGNLIDRLATGRVTDFLAFSFMDFPVFNVADMSIVSGVTILIAWLLIVPDPSKDTEDDTP